MKNYESLSSKEKLKSFALYTYVTCFSMFIVMFMINIENNIPFLIAASIVTAFFRVVVGAVFVETIIFGNREKTLEQMSLKRFIFGLLHCILVYGIIIIVDQFVISIYFEPISMGIIFETISLALARLYRFFIRT
jgi:hypothetical protein